MRADKGCVGADCIQVWVRMLKQICVQCNTSSHTLTHTCIHAMRPSISALSLEQRKLLYSLVHGYRDETAKTALWCCSLSFISSFHSLFLNSNQTPGLSVPSISRNSLLTSAHSHGFTGTRSRFPYVGCGHNCADWVNAQSTLSHHTHISKTECHTRICSAFLVGLVYCG